LENSNSHFSKMIAAATNPHRQHHAI